MTNIVVLKFGGSSVGDKDNLANNLANILEIIQGYLAEGKKIIVVVSALAGETRKLKAIADQLFNEKHLAYYDGVLSMGEVFSSNLLNNYLNSKGIKSVALNNEKLPILTDSNYGNANIIKVEVNLINEYLAQNFICIVPGYIGKDIHGNTTTLGFDGSDTTAIAISGAIKAQMCYLFKDVDGVFSANPRRVLQAKKISQIAYKDMYAFSLLGARIIHPKAVEIAYKQNFPITILPNFNHKSSGTLITTTQDDCANSYNIVGLTYYPDNNENINLAIIGSNLLAEKFSNSLKDFLTKNKIAEISYDHNYLDNAIVLKLFKNQDLNESLIKLHSFLGLDDKNVSVDDKELRLNPNNLTYFDPAFKNQT